MIIVTSTFINLRSGWCGFIIQWSLWVASNFQSNSSGHYSNNSIYLHPGEMIILDHIVTLINVRLHQYWAILIRFSTLCHLFDSKRHNFLRVSNLHRSVIQRPRRHISSAISPLQQDWVSTYRWFLLLRDPSAVQEQQKRVLPKNYWRVQSVAE